MLAHSRVSSRAFTLYEDIVSPSLEIAIHGLMLTALEKYERSSSDPNARSRVVRFGYTYCETKRWVRDPPGWLKDFRDHVRAQIGRDDPFESITIAEYPPGSGIAPHVDIPQFHPTTAIVTLHEGAIFKLHDEEPRGRGDEETQAARHKPQALSILLPRRSVLVFDATIRHSAKVPKRDRYRYAIVLRSRC